MDAVEFLKNRKRICDSVVINCDKCPLSNQNNGTDAGCGEIMWKYPDKCVAIVEKWAEEHPVKTKKQKFLELFNADTPRKWHKDCEKTCNANVPCSFCLWWDEEYKGERV